MLTIHILKQTASIFATLSLLVGNITSPIQDSKVGPETPTVLKNEISMQFPFAEMTTEERVRTYFFDVPELAEIAKCESEFRQYSKGDVLRGDKDQNDVGVMQINERYHLVQSMNMNLDIYTLEGNMAYARALYKDKGLQPWKASKACWHKELAMSN
jgi:hypothetical protein